MSKYYDKELPDIIYVTYGGRYSGRTYRELEKLKKENKKLKDANKKLVKDNCEILQQKIDKAINYIEHIDDFDIKDFRRKELLKILRGEENEKI